VNRENDLFNYYFNLKLSERIDRRFASILSSVLILFTSAILIVANLNYEKLNLISQQIIKERYRQMVSELILSEKDKTIMEAVNDAETAALLPVVDTALKKSTANSRLAERQAIAANLMKNNVILKNASSNQAGIASNFYADLPDLDDIDPGAESDNFVELSRSTGNGGRIISTAKRGGSRYMGDLKDLMRKPFDYRIKRQGQLYIELTDELLRDANEEKRGYRDPNDIQRVVYKNYAMIEQCFNREARFIAGLSGYIKIQFSISPAGYVIPESIKILSSTLRNRQIEQCIKNYVKRWRGFSRLDDSMGIATVVQKFVFN